MTPQRLFLHLGAAARGIVGHSPYIQGSRFVTSGVELIRRLTVSSFRTKIFFTMLTLGRVLIFFFGTSRKSVAKTTFACVSAMARIVGNLCNTAHLRTHARKPRSTTLHHPFTQSDNEVTKNTTNHNNSVYIWISLVTVCIFFRVLLVNKGTGRVIAGLGNSGERRVVGQFGRCHRQGPWVAKQQYASTCGGLQARRSSSKLCRWQATASDTGTLRRDPRGGILADFSEDPSKTFHIVSRLQSKGHPLSAHASVGELYRPYLEDHRRRFAAKMLARLARASGRCVSRKVGTSRRLDLDVICFSDEKIISVDAVAPGSVFAHRLGETGAT